MNRAQGPFRLLYTTQSGGLRLFWRLHRTLDEQQRVEAAAFFATNRFEYNRFTTSFPEFEASGVECLREWELLERARALAEPDHDLIDHWEREIGDPTLWNALITDRRLGFPLRAQFVQDYRPAYKHDDLLKLLTVALKEISAQIERAKPDAILGLNAVTLYDYLYYLIARQRNIPYLQLKLTRVENYVSFFTDPFSVSPHIADSYRRLKCADEFTKLEAEALAAARQLIGQARSERLVYEGAVRSAASQSRPGVTKRAQGFVGRLAGAAGRVRHAWTLRDPHYPLPFRYSIYSQVVKPMRRRLQARLFDVRPGDEARFATEHAGRYVLFALNTEPEVALLAYGRPYRNQIETARNLAAALPVGWTLVVKEHPNARGYRSRGFYRRLREIPNVRLVAPMAKSGPLLEQAALVALVYGTVGLEALIRHKPLVVFSRAPYEIFPSTMVRYVADPWSLGSEIRGLLDDHAHDELALEAYIGAHVSTGVRANLFTELLGKGEREAMNTGGTVEEQYGRLAEEACRRIGEERTRLASAQWT
ncbi:capsular polysaccharide export protein, LipB/KpsS family [Algihabitans albus]|uniref:capsular polysaccharide export protein, LipB/KpsS family n=1 Tax=Algihabitans albus TaxID=2164067 RepID=UPI000E5CFA41|nr:hypothetical protein [Algihabitans albus]